MQLSAKLQLDTELILSSYMRPILHGPTNGANQAMWIKDSYLRQLPVFKKELIDNAVDKVVDMQQVGTR